MEVYILMMTFVFLGLMKGCEFAKDAYHQEVAGDSATVEWGYTEENGPDIWGQLNPEYALCTLGKHQSPIDLGTPTATQLPVITFNYHPTILNIRNTGYTLQVEYDEGSWIEVEGTKYELKQFHFHAPGEHTVAAQPFPMEMHYVHRSADDTLAVIGVLIERGSDNPMFASICAHLPSAAGGFYAIGNVTVNADELLPVQRETYRYEGSLTTPPCSEGVKWFVLTEPLELSDTQIARFEAILRGNNRPVQPLNGRELLVDIKAKIEFG